MMRKLKLLGAALIATTGFSSAGYAATPFDGINVLVGTTFNSQSSDIQGVLAAGGNTTLFNYSVNSLAAATPYGGAGGWGLVVGGNLIFTNGSVGTLVTNPAKPYSGGTLSGAANSVNYTAGTFTGASPINFGPLMSQATSISTNLAGYANPGTATLSGSSLTLTGVTNTAGVNVFTVSGTDLQATHSIAVNNVNTSTGTILVNVTGAFAQLAAVNGELPFDPFGGRVLFNFNSATQVNFNNTGLHASVLAPNAQITSGSSLTGTGGHLQGIAIANSWNGDFQVHTAALPDVLLAVPEPETYAMMLAGLGLMGFVVRRRRQV